MNQKKQTIDDFIRDLSAPDKPFCGTRIDNDKYKKYEQLKFFAIEIKANGNDFIKTTVDYLDEIPNDRRNGVITVNIVTPVNINNEVIKDCLSRMIKEADNFVVATTEKDGHKLVRFGFGVRDIWVDERQAN